MISISRDLARLLRAVLRKAGAKREYGHLLELSGSSAGLRVRAQLMDAAVEFARPGLQGDETLFLPFEALEDVEGKSNTAVSFIPTAEGVEARWDDSGIPRSKTYTIEKKASRPTFPSASWQPTLISTEFLKALGEASQCTSGNHPRYATEKIQLQGKRGAIAATDGRQALIQAGFSFPWDGDLLIPSLPLFRCRELPLDDPATICASDTHLGIRLGDNWTIFLTLDKSSRYPDVDKIVPSTSDRTTTLRLSAEDAAFLSRSLAKLPGADGDGFVTVDLDGQVALRAKDEGQQQPTEVILGGSTATGEPVRLCSARQYLGHAVSLGLSEFVIAGNDKPIVAKDATRTYVWMSQSPSSALPPSDKAIRISTREDSSPSTQARKVEPMPQAHTNGDVHVNGHAHTNGDDRVNGDAHAIETDAKANGIGTVIAEAQALRDYLHDGYLRAARLVATIKKNRKQSRIVQSTLAALRGLHEIEA